MTKTPEGERLAILNRYIERGGTDEAWRLMQEEIRAQEAGYTEAATDWEQRHWHEVWAHDRTRNEYGRSVVLAIGLAVVFAALWVGGW